MKREQFIQKLRKYAKTKKISFSVSKKRGKGGHWMAEMDGRITTIQSGELTPFHIDRCCQQLDIDPADL